MSWISDWAKRQRELADHAKREAKKRIDRAKDDVKKRVIHSHLRTALMFAALITIAVAIRRR